MLGSSNLAERVQVIEHVVEARDERTLSITLEDLDGDGDLDLFTGGVQLNDGHGVFQTAWNSSIETEIAMGDVDGDGMIDLVGIVLPTQGGPSQHLLLLGDGPLAVAI